MSTPINFYPNRSLPPVPPHTPVLFNSSVPKYLQSSACKLGACNRPPFHPWGTGALKRRGRAQVFRAAASREAGGCRRRRRRSEACWTCCPRGLTYPSCEHHPSDRDLTETSRAPDQWLNPRTLLPVRDLTSNFPLSVSGPTRQVSLSGNNGNTDSFLLLAGTTERRGLTAGPAEAHGLKQPRAHPRFPGTACCCGMTFYTGRSQCTHILPSELTSCLPCHNKCLQHSYLLAV